MKLRASTKILFGFIALIGLGYGASYGYTKMRLKGVDLNPIGSSDLCLLAVGPKAGVKIIVANQMVQVVESTDKFGAEESNGGGAMSGSVKKRIPVRELVGTLGGNPDSLQSFLKKMRDTTEETETSEDAPLWSKDDIEKAIAGDAALKGKLENDIGVTLDGTPMTILNRVAYFYGIRVKIPVSIAVPNAKGTSISTFDIVTFQPRVLTKFFKNMQTKFYDKSQLQTYYASYLKDEKPAAQDIADTLKKLFSRVQASEEMAKIRRIVGNSTILVNQSMIESIDMVDENDGKVKTYGLKLRLTQEGKNRLWKFSSEGGTQILVVSKGVAIAAATIGTELNSEELAIKQIADRSLVEEAVSLVHAKSK